MMKEDRNLLSMIALLVVLIWASKTLLLSHADPLFQFGAILILLLIGLTAWEEVDPEIKEKADLETKENLETKEKQDVPP